MQGPVFSRIDFLPLLRKGRKWILEKRSVFGRSPTETLGSVEDLETNETNIPWYMVIASNSRQVLSDEI